MPSKYTHKLVIYESWLADLAEPSKEFSPAEKWQVVEAICLCQLQGNVKPLLALDLSLKRALSLPTMSEQIRALIDKQQGACSRATQAAEAKKAVIAARTAKIEAQKAEVEANQRMIAEQDRLLKLKKWDEEQRAIFGSERWDALRSAFDGADLANVIYSLAVEGDYQARQAMPTWRTTRTCARVNVDQWKQKGAPTTDAP